MIDSDLFKYGVQHRTELEIKRWWWCCYLCLLEETFAFIPAGLSMATDKKNPLHCSIPEMVLQVEIGVQGCVLVSS